MNKKSTYIILIFVLFLGFMSVTFKFIEKRIVNSVIEELKRDYVPGPFSPGFDPDKLDPSLLNDSQSEPDIEPDVEQTLKDPSYWNNSWNH